MGFIRKYGGLLFAVLTYVVVNLADYFRPMTCFDCFFPYRLPFTFFEEGGYAGGGGIVWRGLLLDLLALGATAVILQFVWDRSSMRRRQVRG